MRRRSFLKAMGTAVGGSAAAASTTTVAQQVVDEPKVAGLPRRVLGRTGAKVSIIGFPGLALVHDEQDVCTAAIHDAHKRGVNYFDVAPAYGKGDAEIKMGIGLEGIDRDDYFLACKTKMRDKDGARAELERSLDRLKTDRFDLYQLHALIEPDESIESLAEGGAIETLVKAKQEGLVGHLGFSAHTTRAALTAMKRFRFDTVMFPINFVEFFTLGFGKAVLELAAKQGAAVAAIKPMCRGAWPKDMERTRRWWYRPVEDEDEISLALKFTLSQKPVAAGIPPAFLDLLDKAIDAAGSYRPITEAETEQVRELAGTCDSIFRRHEERVSGIDPGEGPVYADSPHEGCPCRFA